MRPALPVDSMADGEFPPCVEEHPTAVAVATAKPRIMAFPM
jgi:hypothetical protein